MNGNTVSVHIKNHGRGLCVVLVRLACGRFTHIVQSYVSGIGSIVRDSWAPSQYPKSRLSVRSRKVSKPRDQYSKLSYRFEIWQAHRQHCCRSACQISERSGNSKYKSRGFETLRDLTERRLFGYWDGALVPSKDEQNLRNIHGLVQDSSALAMEILQSCTKPSIYCVLPPNFKIVIKITVTGIPASRPFLQEHF